MVYLFMFYLFAAHMSKFHTKILESARVWRKILCFFTVLVSTTGRFIIPRQLNVWIDCNQGFKTNC